MHNPALHQEATVANQIKILNPPGAVPAQGLYSQAAFVPAGTDTYHIAGQVSVDQDGTIVGSDDFGAQVRQVYRNLEAVLKALGESCDSIVSMRTYLVDAGLLPTFMSERAGLFPSLFSGPAYPPNTLLIIDGLVRPEFLIEVEAVAARRAS